MALVYGLHPAPLRVGKLSRGVVLKSPGTAAWFVGALQSSESGQTCEAPSHQNRCRGERHNRIDPGEPWTHHGRHLRVVLNGRKVTGTHQTTNGWRAFW